MAIIRPVSFRDGKDDAIKDYIQDLADREFQGSYSAAVRACIQRYKDGEESPWWVSQIMDKLDNLQVPPSQASETKSGGVHLEFLDDIFEDE